MKPFIDCNIWIIPDNPESHKWGNFYYIYLIHQYNSLTGSFNTEFSEGFYKIPESEIKNLHLIQMVDWNILQQKSIPILKNNDG
jgi:hypothetical protein